MKSLRIVLTLAVVMSVLFINQLNAAKFVSNYKSNPKLSQFIDSHNDLKLADHDELIRKFGFVTHSVDGSRYGNMYIPNNIIYEDGVHVHPKAIGLSEMSAVGYDANYGYLVSLVKCISIEKGKANFDSLISNFISKYGEPYDKTIFDDDNIYRNLKYKIIHHSKLYNVEIQFRYRTKLERSFINVCIHDATKYMEYLDRQDQEDERKKDEATKSLKKSF